MYHYKICKFNFNVHLSSLLCHSLYCVLWFSLLLKCHAKLSLYFSLCELALENSSLLDFVASAADIRTATPGEKEHFGSSKKVWKRWMNVRGCYFSGAPIMSAGHVFANCTRSVLLHLLIVFVYVCRLLWSRKKRKAWPRGSGRGGEVNKPSVCRKQDCSPKV